MPLANGETLATKIDHRRGARPDLKQEVEPDSAKNTSHTARKKPSRGESIQNLHIRTISSSTTKI